MTACRLYPCTDNENSLAVCKEDGDGDAESPEGRTCTCVTAHHKYQDDLLGCLGERERGWRQQQQQSWRGSNHV